jgi:FAD dependent oxidoreductase
MKETPMSSEFTRPSRRSALKGMALGTVAGLAGRQGRAAAAADAAVPNARELEPVDVLVCGGGPAGIAAAMMAARQGRKTLLVERYGRLGGMAVQAMVGPLMGRVQSAWVDRIIERIGGRAVDYEFIDLKYAELLNEAGARFLLHTSVVEPLVDGNRVAGARLLTRQGTANIRAKVTVDATGDGEVAFGAGAEYDQGRGAGPSWEADGLCQPMTIMFRVSGVNHAETMEAHGGRKRYRFPDGRSWNEVTHDAHARGVLPPTVGFVRTYLSQREDQRVINATQVNGLDGTDVRDLTKAELDGRGQVKPIVEFLRSHAPGFKDAYVSGMPAVIGVRETRRIRGVEHLTLRDLLEGRESDTAIVRGASFPVDIHNPSGIGQAMGLFPGEDPKVKPYDVPYGCLVPKSTDGLLIAGRCISGAHEAMASYRVQVIAMSIGVAAGTAAALAVKHDVAPRAVSVKDLQAVVFESDAQ